MLARRLMILVLVLTGVTLVAALLAPPPREPAPPSTGGAEAPAEIAEPVELTLDTAEGQRDYEVTEGDIVHLVVRSSRPDSVELRGLDLIKTVAADTPAEFDLLADTPGDYPVLLLDAEETVGNLRVMPQEG